MHDLVRLYASEHLTENAAEDSFRRVLDLYALTTDVAWKRFVTGTNPPGVDPFPTASSALEWVLAERSGLVETVLRGGDEHARRVVLLAADLKPFLERAHLVADQLAVALTAVGLVEDATEADLPERCRPVAWGDLGSALVAARRYDEAIPVMYQAAGLFADIGDDLAGAITRMNVGISLNEAGRYAEARTVLVDLPPVFRDRAQGG